MGYGGRELRAKATATCACRITPQGRGRSDRGGGGGGRVSRAPQLGPWVDRSVTAGDSYRAKRQSGAVPNNPGQYTTNPTPQPPTPTHNNNPNPTQKKPPRQSPQNTPPPQPSPGRTTHPFERRLCQHGREPASAKCSVSNAQGGALAGYSNSRGLRQDVQRPTPPDSSSNASGPG